MSRQRIVRLRLINQRIAGTRFRTAGEVVEWMGAVQAQDLLAGQWAVGLRTRKETLSDVEEAVSQRKIVRTWPMRGTLHFVAPADIRWMLKYLAQRNVHRSSTRYRQLHLDSATFSRSARIFEKALAGGKQIRRQEAYELLERNRISCKGQRGIHILGRLSQDGLLCLGPRDGTSTTFVLLDEWVPSATIPPRDEAIARLVLKYFTSHGPATIEDFAWWSGLTLTDARRGLEEPKNSLVPETFEEKVYWFSGTATSTKNPGTDSCLLPAFDEFLVAYRDRSAAIDSKHAKRMHPGGGFLHPTIVIGNEIAGTWGRTIKNEDVTIRVDPFRTLNKKELGAIVEAAESYGTFLGKSVVVRMNS